MTETPPNRLRELSDLQGVRREALALEFDVRAETISRWYDGEIPTKHLRQLAKRFGVTVSYLMRDDEQVAA